MARNVFPTRRHGVIRYLQGWIGVVGLMALGNTVSCFVHHQFLAERLYTAAPNLVNGLTARLFGVWTLLAAILRIYCSLNICNIQVYNLTLISFVVVFGHFVSEIFIYKTTTITSVGVIAPVIISGLSMVWMLVGYKYLGGSPLDSEKELPKPGIHEMIAQHKIKSR